MTLFSALRHPGEGPLPDEGPMAGFDGATGWLNSEPLTPEALRGRVVAVDFWTYTCVNWLRTLPYVRAWAAKYHEHGLTVIGVHTPEFGFERDGDNVAAAARDMQVDYPIAMDADYGVWRDFANNYWPALYIADAEGRIRYHHYGEGEYAMSEMVIQQLLRAAGHDGFDPGLVAVDPIGTEVAADWETLRTPETYVAFGRSPGFASPDDAVPNLTHDYPAPMRLGLNQWAPVGVWRLSPHAAILDQPGGRIAFRFQARDVNLVMGPATAGSSVPFRVLLDGEPAGAAHGTDVDASANGTVMQQRLYQLIRQTSPIAERTIEIEFLEAGVEAYCFTFG